MPFARTSEGTRRSRLRPIPSRRRLSLSSRTAQRHTCHSVTRGDSPCPRERPYSAVDGHCTTLFSPPSHTAKSATPGLYAVYLTLAFLRMPCGAAPRLRKRGSLPPATFSFRTAARRSSTSVSFAQNGVLNDWGDSQPANGRSPGLHAFSSSKRDFRGSKGNVAAKRPGPPATEFKRWQCPLSFNGRLEGYLSQWMPANHSRWLK